MQSYCCWWSWSERTQRAMVHPGSCERSEMIIDMPVSFFLYTPFSSFSSASLSSCQSHSAQFFSNLFCSFAPIIILTSHPTSSPSTSSPINDPRRQSTYVLACLRHLHVQDRLVLSICIHTTNPVCRRGWIRPRLLTSLHNKQSSEMDQLAPFLTEKRPSRPTS